MVHAPSLKTAGIFMFLGAMQFGFFFALAEIYYPGYDVSAQAISDLGATCVNGACQFVQPASDIFNASVSLLGVTLLCASYYLWKGYGSKAFPFFVALSGLGAIGVGAFNESFGAVHGLFAFITFAAIGIQAILAFRFVRPPMAYFTLVAGIATLVALVLFGSGTYLGLGFGGMEKMVVYPVLLEGIGFGGYLLSAGDADIR